MNLRALFGTLGVQTMGKKLFVFLGLISVISVRFSPVDITEHADGLIEVSARLLDAFTEEMAEMLLQSSDIAIEYVLTVYADSGKKYEYRAYKGFHYTSLTGMFASLPESNEVFSTKSGEEAIAWFSGCDFAFFAEKPFTALLKARLYLPGASISENPAYLWRGAEPYISFSLPE